jgi:RHS repeat-associated protein
LFTGRRVDILDNGSLKIQYNRNRYYDYYAGRWLTQDPLGYVDAMNLYEYAAGNPTSYADPIGLSVIDWCCKLCCKHECVPGERDFKILTVKVGVASPHPAVYGLLDLARWISNISALAPDVMTITNHYAVKAFFERYKKLFGPAVGWNTWLKIREKECEDKSCFFGLCSSSSFKKRPTYYHKCTVGTWV